MRLATFAAAFVFTALSSVGALAEGQAPSRNGAYCLESADGGSKNCTFATMAACNAAKKMANDKCSPNAETTGSGSPGAAPSPSSPPIGSPSR
jgi:hypothetical protein